AAANSKEREPMFPSVTDCTQRTLHARVRTSGCDPYGVDQREPRADIGRERRSGDPAPLERMLSLVADVRERRIDGEMRVHRRVVIADDSETRGSGHEGSIYRR